MARCPHHCAFKRGEIMMRPGKHITSARLLEMVNALYAAGVCACEAVTPSEAEHARDALARALQHFEAPRVFIGDNDGLFARLPAGHSERSYKFPFPQPPRATTRRRNLQGEWL